MNENWLRYNDHKMPINQTGPVCIPTSGATQIGHSDDPDLLEVLSLYEGANDEYDKDFDASVSTNSSISTKSGSGEDTVDAMATTSKMLRSRPTGSLQHISSACSTKSLNCASTNTIPFIEQNASLISYRDGFGSTENGLIHRHQRSFGLSINQEPFTNIVELPSPSSASLHSANGQIAIQELATKSNSAPILLKKERALDQFSRQLLVSRLLFLI